MATTDSGVSLPDQQSNLEGLPNSLASLTLQNDGGQSDNSDEKPMPDSPPRPLKIYTPQQLLFLYESPLVQVPNGMPDLKDWFGSVSDIPEGTIVDTTARPSFRSALTQPSQMGNFKHQSLRAPDRDRDTREFRDKEGHEHLRNLSDKYDRDRLGTNARNKDRDAAPHLTAGTSRLVGQTAGSNTTRRTEGREGARRRGDGDDWRRGSDTPRRDRDDRERPRSRVRDTSRPRRDPSTGRRDRDKTRDRDDRRDRDDYRRDYDRDSEHDDPRRWRDDGKREERLARRAADRERPRERPVREYDSYRPTYDDTPGKKPRDRKVNGDDRDRDDRREREKEKEPAWMDTYIPSPSSGGIMGGNADEIDGIQAWKKDMKEKQEKEKSALQVAADDAPAPSLPPAPSANGTSSASNGLDEIQMFRMLMKKEDEKKNKSKRLIR
ncbi:Zinc finger CCCH domain-containing protein [Salix suchowensis]|nr:Zinc finger CCCH domain-containing protein [Salix suchowensis]